MLSSLKIYAVEILSVVMGLWLVWIVIIYSTYIKKLRKKDRRKDLEGNSEEILRDMRNLRKRAYNLAVTMPSYFIFWVVVTVWGFSFILNGS